MFEGLATGERKAESFFWCFFKSEQRMPHIVRVGFWMVFDYLGRFSLELPAAPDQFLFLPFCHGASLLSRLCQST